MSWQDIIKNEEDDMFSTARADKIHKEANKWLDHTIKKVTDIKRIINNEGEVGDEYLKEIKSLSRMAEEMVDRAFGYGGADDYDSAYDTTFDQRAYEMSQADRTR